MSAAAALSFPAGSSEENERDGLIPDRGGRVREIRWRCQRQGDRRKKERKRGGPVGEGRDDGVEWRGGRERERRAQDDRECPEENEEAERERERERGRSGCGIWQSPGEMRADTSLPAQGRPMAPKGPDLLNIT